MQAGEALFKGIPIIQQWVTRFKRDRPLPGAKVSVRDEGGLEKEEGFCLSAIADIEESVWAPKYGLKGMIDASVEATFVDLRPEKVQLPEAKVLPLFAHGELWHWLQENWFPGLAETCSLIRNSS